VPTNRLSAPLSARRRCLTISFATRDVVGRVEALPIRPIAHISHGANPSLKIHLLPNAGTDRNVRSFEYLAAPAVDQCIVRQCSSFLLSSNCFFTSQLVAFTSRPDSRQSRSKTERFHHVPSTEVAKRSSLNDCREPGMKRGLTQPVWEIHPVMACQSSLICSTRFSAPRTPRVHLDMQTWRRTYLDAQTRSLLGAVDCSSIERPHSNPAPFANVKIHGLTLPCVNERIKSGRKCAQRRLKHFHDQRGIMTYVRM
jgi:hypothetical protein